MPYVSKAQQRLFHSDPKLKKLAPEWDAATPSIARLPERIRLNQDGNANKRRRQGKK